MVIHRRKENGRTSRFSISQNADFILQLFSTVILCCYLDKILSMRINLGRCCKEVPAQAAIGTLDQITFRSKCVKKIDILRALSQALLGNVIFGRDMKPIPYARFSRGGIRVVRNPVVQSINIMLFGNPFGKFLITSPW